MVYPKIKQDASPPKLIDQVRQVLRTRHRYTEIEKRKYITIELNVETHEWRPNTKYIPYNKIYDIHVDFNDKYLRKLIKEAEAKWNPKRRICQLQYCSIGINRVDKITFIFFPYIGKQVFPYIGKGLVLDNFFLLLGEN